MIVRSPEVTYKIMSSIKSKNTKPELLLRRGLWSKGLRYRVNVKNLPGKPDVVFTRAKIAVFCDGDFWHGNNWKIRGMSSLEEELARYSEFWQIKIRRNIERDKENTKKLQLNGWTVLRFWESEIKDDLVKCVSTVVSYYETACDK